MKKHRRTKKEEMKIMRSHFIRNEVLSHTLSQRNMIYPYNCSNIITVGSSDDIGTTDFLKGFAVFNLCNYGHGDIRANVFLKPCAEQSTWLGKLGVKGFIEYIKNCRMDPGRSKELSDNFDNYLNSRKPLKKQEREEYQNDQDFIHCTAFQERPSTSRRYDVSRRFSYPSVEECFDQHYQSIENTPKNLKPLTPSSNSSHLKPLPNPNQANNGSTIFMIVILLIFSMISLLYCKYGNKSLRRNKNADRDLPVSQPGNKKTRRRSSIKDTESLCLKLVNSIESYEPKRGY
ncbi:MAG: hypothetical protein sL5_04420 [Candidatus Mesenet longicola]|uniref:Uncharacterized protein n=1 Tax=Candidatus Mesenet longicola TaxID=1892558 RepID=A0A8J3MM03_9RICK|nr:MAG: hypothetical protein sGL2_04530 [Candidatus Mesenet longicola]GHM59449.1 MAG: hypothetical protein sL5_04420 [Candidatus Mesenet longicola]